MGTVQWDLGGMSEVDNLHNQADTREAEVLSCSICINLAQPQCSIYTYLG